MNAVRGQVAPQFQSIREYLEAACAADEDYSFHLAAYQGAELVIDLHAGEAITADTLMIPFSTSKNSIAFSIALLVDRGQLNLDAPVAAYWPQFAAEGKQNVLVRELLSHQAGLPEGRPRLTDEESADAQVGAARLAAQLPWWRPGAAFGYHGLTIGVLASELIRRITGSTVQQFFEVEISAPRNLDFHLGSSSELEERVVELQPMLLSAPAPAPDATPFVRRPGQIGREVFAGVAVQRTGDEAIAYARRQRAAANQAALAAVGRSLPRRSRSVMRCAWSLKASARSSTSSANL